jgi:hypothetical protein
MNIYLKNEGQECKTGTRGLGTMGEERVMERVKEGEYGQCTLCTCMKTEQ